MNKLFTKIVGVALGASMAVGVGVAVANNREVAPVHAASEELAFHFQGSSLATGTTYQAWSGTVSSATTSKVSSATWQITVGNNSAQLGTNAKSTNLSKTTLGNGNFSAASGVATALSITTSTKKYSAVYCTTGMSNITKGELIFTGTNGGAITTAWLLSSTDGSTWTVESSKTSNITTGSTFTVTKSSTAKQFAFVCYWNLTNSGGLKGFEYKLYGEYEETQTITADPASKEAYTDETISLTTNATSASWALSNNTCGATLSAASGKSVTVSATSAGSVRVTATASGYTSAYVDLTFAERPTSPYITPTKFSTSGYTGQDETISVTYGNLTTGLAVSSGNTSVVDASVGTDDGQGNADIYLEFNGAGSTTVSLKDGSTQLATISVSVTASSVTITGLAATGSVYTGKTLDLGSTITVTAVGSYSSNVTWESDDTSVATVTSAGVVSGVAAGSADITVTSDDYPSATMTCTVTVSEAPLQYVMTFGSTKNTNPTEIKTNDSYHSTYSSVDSDVVASDFSKIYGISTSQLKCGSGSASATISFTIPDSSYITSVVVVVATAGGTSMNVTSGAASAQTENQTIVVGTLTFDDYLASEKSNKVTLASSASGAFYLSSITINYANFTPELHASSTSVEAAVNTSNQSINLTSSYYTPTSYTAAVKSGSSLTASAVTFDTSSTPHTATFTTGSKTGATVFTITGTGSGKSASVDVTVTVTEARNLLTLSITTASDATSFKVGDSFDVRSLVITATFDAAPTTVVYSKANDNLGALTFAPAIGYTFVDSDIGTVTSVIAELEVGTGDEYIEYTIAVTDKTYAAQVTAVSDLWDGQQIYFGNGSDRVNVVHAGGNQLTSQEATIHATKGLCIDDLEHSAAYTVHREKIDDVVYYSFQNGGYYLEASNTSNNYLTRTTTLSDKCRYTISISSGEVTMTNKGNADRPQFRWNSSSNWFSQYASSSTLDKAVIYAITSYSESAVASYFEETWLHMSDYTTSQGWCADEEHAYYSKAKVVWQAMDEYEKAAISAEGEARLSAWAAANGETLDSNMDLVTAARISPLANVVNNGATVAIIVVSAITLTSIGGYFFIRRRKKQY